MKVQNTIGCILSVILLGAATCAAQITCGSISQAVFNNADTKEELVADVPRGATFVRLDLYLRMYAPGYPWHHCDPSDDFCSHNAEFTVDPPKVDEVDGTTTYHVLGQMKRYGSFNNMTIPRLVVTYKTSEKMCKSQGTLNIPPGQDRPMRLFAAPGMPFSVMQDYVRIIPPVGPNQPEGWTLCDDSTGLKWHLCLKDIFQVFSGPEADQADGATGRLFICTSKPNNIWDGRARKCRGVLLYQPGRQAAPGIPSELYEAASATAPARVDATPVQPGKKDDK